MGDYKVNTFTELKGNTMQMQVFSNIFYTFYYVGVKRAFQLKPLN